MRTRLLTALLAAAVVACLTPVASAVWEQPQQTFPSGGTPPLTTSLVPQTRAGLLTVTNGSIRATNPSSFLPTTGTPVPRGSITATGGVASANGAYAAGVRGATPANPGGGTEIGVLGQAGVAGTDAYGIYATSGANGSGGYNASAWAGYFNGATGIAGQLTVLGYAGTCSNNPAQQCSNNADCGIAGSPTCVGSTHPRISGTGRATFGGNPAPSAPGSLSAYAVRLTAGSTTLYQGALVGVVTANGSNAEGQAVVGRVNPSVTCGATSLCAGVYSTDGSAPYDAPGRWAGYFNGTVNVDGAVSLAAGQATIDVSDPIARVTNPPQFANLPVGSFLGGVLPGGSSVLWGVAFDGEKLWFGGWAGNARTLARVDPVSLTTEATCTSIWNIRGLTYDGQYLWYNSASALAGRIDPSAITAGGNCNETIVNFAYSMGTFAPAVGNRTPTSPLTSVWFGGSTAAAPAGTYLVEVDPASGAQVSATRVTTTVSTPKGVLDDGTYVWLSGVNDGGGVLKLARVRKTDKAVSVFDYVAANCPATKPSCLTGNVDTYRGLTYGAGSVWVSAREGSVGTQRLLRVDPATGALQDAFPAGGNFVAAYDGTWVWTVDANAPFTLRGVRAYDGQTTSIATAYGQANVRQMAYDGTALFVTEFSFGRALKFLK